MAMELSYDVDDIVLEAHSFPNPYKVIKEKIHNVAMTCYSVKMTIPSNQIKAEYLLLSGYLSDAPTEQVYAPGYRLYVGGQDTLGVAMGLRDYVPLHRNQDAHLKLRARKSSDIRVEMDTDATIGPRVISTTAKFGKETK